MKDVAAYLMKNYYNNCSAHISPESEQQLIKALDITKDKTFVVHEDGEIKGAGIFLTLEDDTYENIKKFDLSDVEDLAYLITEDGLNIHFILVAGSGVRAILSAIREIKKIKKAKTISWWNPNMSYLHRYNFN
jgi:hypothetical protein